MQICPTCGHKVAKTRTKPAADVTAMTDTDLFAHYKRTAPYEDLKFLVAHSTHYPDVTRDGLKLLGDAFTVDGRLTMPRPEFNRRYVNLSAAWRGASNAAERAAALPIAA